MRDEVARIEDQLRSCFEGGAWHGPAVLEVLAGVSHEDAHAHPIPNVHSIWELVLHLTGCYWLVLRRLKGDGSPLTAEEDWPAVPTPTAEEWRDAVRTLARLNQELRSAVRVFPASRLDEPIVPEPPYTAHTQFIGVTQHNLYHAGQIAILKKALAG